MPPHLQFPSGSVEHCATVLGSANLSVGRCLAASTGRGEAELGWLGVATPSTSCVLLCRSQILLSELGSVLGLACELARQRCGAHNSALISWCASRSRFPSLASTAPPRHARMSFRLPLGTFSSCAKCLKKFTFARRLSCASCGAVFCQACVCSQAEVKARMSASPDFAGLFLNLRAVCQVCLRSATGLSAARDAKFKLLMVGESLGVPDVFEY